MVGVRCQLVVVRWAAERSRALSVAGPSWRWQWGRSAGERGWWHVDGQVPVCQLVVMPARDAVGRLPGPQGGRLVVVGDRHPSWRSAWDRNSERLAGLTLRRIKTGPLTMGPGPCTEHLHTKSPPSEPESGHGTLARPPLRGNWSGGMCRGKPGWPRRPRHGSWHCPALRVGVRRTGTGPGGRCRGHHGDGSPTHGMAPGTALRCGTDAWDRDGAGGRCRDGWPVPVHGKAPGAARAPGSRPGGRGAQLAGGRGGEAMEGWRGVVAGKWRGGWRGRTFQLAVHRLVVERRRRCQGMKGGLGVSGGPGLAA